jgi:hypothetical protein
MKPTFSGERIPLNHPAQIDGVSVDALAMREPTVEDMLVVKKSAGKSPEDQELSLFANLCEVDPSVIRGLTLRDYKRVQKAFAKLTEDEEGGSPLE